MNIYGIAPDLENRIRARDKFCVYCHVRLKKYRQTAGKGTRKAMATIEHFNNTDVSPDNTLNIAICCVRCNRSKGETDLMKWFESPYCMRRNINERTVSPVVKKWLRECAEAQS